MKDKLETPNYYSDPYNHLPELKTTLNHYNMDLWHYSSIAVIVKHATFLPAAAPASRNQNCISHDPPVHNDMAISYSHSPDYCVQVHLHPGSTSYLLHRLG